MYDVTNLSSYENVRNWVGTIDINCTPNTIKILVANKIDLIDQRKV